MRSNIEGKVVVIAGASSGMGEVASWHLSAQGATVVLGARRMERLRTLAGEITTAGGKALAVETDVTDRRQVQRLVGAAVETFGRIDCSSTTPASRCSRPWSGSRPMSGTG
jgi:NADP-dependent 3-hydroxy acid dehydrogenase YdfG